MTASIKNFSRLVGKSQLDITVRARRVDVIKNGVWVGRGQYSNKLDLGIELNREEFSWIEHTVRDYHSV